MDRERFDTLAREIGGAATRRTAVKALGGAVLGLGLLRSAAGASAQAVTPADCLLRRCQKKKLDDKCRNRRDCCPGLRCDNRRCRFESGSGGPGDFCKTSRDCDSNFICRFDQCVPRACFR